MTQKRLIEQLLHWLTEQAAEGLHESIQLCKLRRHRASELVHWLHCMLQLPDSDLHQIIRFFNLSPTAIDREIVEALSEVRAGYEGGPVISTQLRDLLREAWFQASVGAGDDKIRSGHILLAALQDPDFNQVLGSISPTLARLSGDELSNRFPEATAASPEMSRLVPPAPESAGLSTAAPLVPPAATSAGRRSEALPRFTDDLTEKARQGQIDPVVGRDEEIRQIIDILMRRRQNNPILTGDAGVGKTAVVEGFALRIAAGDVPPALRNVTLRVLDVARMQAGASVRGEFENRLKRLVDEVKAAGNVILFIDEAHTLIGAGGAAGAGDAANLLKPALARGELRTIAATTADEYRKFIEEDPALKRRFQQVAVAEPSESQTVLMLRQLAPVLAKHHQVIIFNQALTAAARLSSRYLPSRQLPDKAVSVLDTACARVAVSQHATAPRVEDTRRLITSLQAELGMLEREQTLGANHVARLQAVRAELTETEARLVELEARWKEELALVEQISRLRQQLQVKDAASDAAKSQEWRGELVGIEQKLGTLQGDDPLLFSSVNERAVSEVIADWTGIPVGRMVKDEIQATLKLAQLLGRRVVGQDHALDMIARRIRTAQARLEDPNKPIGSFLLAGPSGTGKTETALALAEARYASDRNLLVFNMNEFKEEHTASSLLGAPPGYVGYGKGGLLTEAIRRRPYSVVLLDEFEKAHKSIQEVFFQVLDQGWTKDREGRFIDFRNTILLFATNAAGDSVINACRDPDTTPLPEILASSVRADLRKFFSDALLGRLVVIPYYPLNSTTLAAVIRLKLGRIQKRMSDNHGISLVLDDSVLKYVSERCTALEIGGRVIDSIITNTLLPDLSLELLNRQLEGQPLSQVTVNVTDGRFTFQFQ